MDRVYDAQIKHNFTCLVAGPSGCGKSTFVKNLLMRQGDLIDVVFDYVIIVLGTEARVNTALSSLSAELTPSSIVSIIELIEKNFDSKEEMFAQFSRDLKYRLETERREGRKGCIVFDDLMSELAECGILVDLFTKFSSHYSLSIIHITQNVFFKSRHAGDNVTIYRNTHVLVLFKNPMDNMVVSNVARRIAPTSSSKLNHMLNSIMDRYRYVVIFGNLDRDGKIKYLSDIFSRDPVPHQKVFEPV